LVLDDLPNGGRTDLPASADLPSPHEDVYLGLKIKQSSRIIHVPRPLYVYRERPGQFYGGLFNFSPGVVVWRAKAMLRVITLVKAAGVAGAGEGVEDLLAPAELYYQLLAEDRVPVKKILRAGLTAGDKFRVVLIRKAPALASSLSRWRAWRRRAWSRARRRLKVLMSAYACHPAPAHGCVVRNFAKNLVLQEYEETVLSLAG
jgi:hypothetical protein